MKKTLTIILIFFALTAKSQKVISTTSYADSLFQNVIKMMQPVRDSVKQQTNIIVAQNKTIDSLKNQIWSMSFPLPFVPIVDSVKKTVIITLPIR